MATAGSFPGKLMFLNRGNGDGPPETFTAIACVTELGFNIIVNTIQQACRDAGAWAEARPNDKSATCDFTLLIKYDAAIGINDIRADVLADVINNFTMSTGESGDPEWAFSGFITSYGESYPVGGFAALQCTLTVTGAPASTDLA